MLYDANGYVKSVSCKFYNQEEGMLKFQVIVIHIIRYHGTVLELWIGFLRGITHLYLVISVLINDNMFNVRLDS